MSMLSNLEQKIDNLVIDKIITIADTNKDGKIDFNEFLKTAT